MSWSSGRSYSKLSPNPHWQSKLAWLPLRSFPAHVAPGLWVPDAFSGLLLCERDYAEGNVPVRTLFLPPWAPVQVWQPRHRPRDGIRARGGGDGLVLWWLQSSRPAATSKARCTDQTMVCHLLVQRGPLHDCVTRWRPTSQTQLAPMPGSCYAPVFALVWPAGSNAQVVNM